MIERALTLLFSALALATALLPRAVSAADDAKKPSSPLDFTVQNIDGTPVDLGTFKGDVLLIVNTASQCGLTPQYEGLQSVYEKYKGQGFAVLAFPANEFGKQEPGTDTEIKQFCSTNYKVSFPLFSKIVVKGEGLHPLYQYLTLPDTNPKFSGEIGWNFAKFLVNRKGEVIARFNPQVKPDAPEVIKALETALAQAK